MTIGDIKLTVNQLLDYQEKMSGLRDPVKLYEFLNGHSTRYGIIFSETKEGLAYWQAMLLTNKDRRQDILLMLYSAPTFGYITLNEPEIIIIDNVKYVL